MLSGTLQPSAVVVNNASTAYTLSGSGQLAGSTSLVKSGTGTLIVSNTNSYTGGTVVTGGTLRVANQSALGDASGTLTVNGGALDLSGNSVTTGGLSGTAGVITTTQPSTTANIVATTSGTNIYSGTIQDGAGTVGLTMNGNGTQILGGTNTFSGDTNVNSGTLKLTESSALSSSKEIKVTSGGTLDASALGVLAISSSQTLVDHGTFNGNLTLSGTLGGRGIITGAVIATSGATVAPGASTGILTLQNGFTLQSGAHLAIQIGGNIPGFGTDGTDGYDQLVVSGSTVKLGGDLQLSLTNPSFKPVLATNKNDLSNADRFVILLNNSGLPIDGQFSNETFTDANFPDYPNQAVNLDGQEFLLFYNTDASGAIGQGDSAALYGVVPEPGTWLLLLSGSGLLLGLRRFCSTR